MKTITAKDIINEIGNAKSVSVEHGYCTIGGKHAYYYVKIGTLEIQDKESTYQYDLVREIEKAFTAIESELLKKNYIFLRKECQFESGRDYVWKCARFETISCVTQIVKVVPSKSFIALQKWLKTKANFNLGITDMYQCDVCIKRSNKWYTLHNYYAEHENYCSKLLERIKAVYKSGYKVSAEISVHEEMDNYTYERYEYEQYGYCDSKLVVTISTPTGRNKQVIK